MKTVHIIQYQWPIKASEPLKQCTGMFDAWNGDQKTHFTSSSNAFVRFLTDLTGILSVI